MSRLLSLRNRQRTCVLDLRRLRQFTRHLLDEELRTTEFELCLHFVAAPEMARLNQTFLQHEGSTDVITFDLAEPGQARLHGEIFLCLDDAIAQARAFRTTWQAELARYIIHGLLHLRGHDDLQPAARRRMKQAENRLLRRLAARFPLRRLGRLQRKS